MMSRVGGALLVALALVAGCDNASGEEPGSGGAPLDGRTFLSTSVTEGGAARPLAGTSRLRLTFEDHRLSADIGCNTMSGGYAVEAGRLAVDDLAITDMGCPADLQAQDTWLSAFLAARPAYRLDGSTLVLTSGTTEITLLDRGVADPDRPLKGTHWVVTSLMDGQSARSVPSDVSAYFDFTESGRVSGSTGCNQFSGSATERDGRIVFGKIVTTKMACLGEAGTVDRAVSTLFDGSPVRWRIEASTLTLTTADGHGVELRAV